jgi:hypothetical protein
MNLSLAARGDAPITRRAGRIAAATTLFPPSTKISSSSASAGAWARSPAWPRVRNELAWRLSGLVYRAA